MKYPVRLTVNGREYRKDVEARTLLVHFLRDEARLTGTHIGCETSICGACTVLLDGKTVKSCTRLAVQADGASVVTIEGWRPRLAQAVWGRKVACIRSRKPSVSVMVCSAVFALQA